jgi:hypothetical protein
MEYTNPAVLRKERRVVAIYKSSAILAAINGIGTPGRQN